MVQAQMLSSYSIKHVAPYPLYLHRPNLCISTRLNWQQNAVASQHAVESQHFVAPALGKKLLKNSRRFRTDSGRLRTDLRLRATGDGDGSKNIDRGVEQNLASTTTREETADESISGNLGGDKEEGANILQEELEKERQRSAVLKQELERAEKKVEEQLRRMENGGGGPGFFSSFSATLRDAVNSLETTLGLKMDEMPIMTEKLDLATIRKVCSQYSATGFYMTELRRYGTGAMVMGNLRCSPADGPTACLDDVAENTRKKLSEALGVELGVWFLVDSTADQTVLVVQPLEEVTARLDAARLKGIRRWPLSIMLMVVTCFSITSVSGINLDPNGAQRDIFTSVFPLAGGLWAVLTVGEIFQRIMAKRYGVKLSPPYLIPSNWLGCLGIATRIESFIPSKAALFDIAAARAVGGWIAALTLTISAFLLDGGVNGGAHPLYVEPTFFQPNLLLSFIQYVIGPYSDDLGNVLPHAVPGLGVPVNPLAFAGLLGLVITSLNLLPAGQLEGGRIIQALFGRKRASELTTVTTSLLGIAGIFGSVLCLVWGFIIVVFRNGAEIPALDEVSEVGRYRIVLGWLLLGGCILMLLPNSAGTFPSTFFTPPSFYGDF